MDLGLAGKAFVLGGGGGGLGAAVATALVDEGARVLLLGRSESRLREAAEQLGPRATWTTCDLTDVDTIASAAEFATDTFGEIEGVLLNGGGPPPGDALALSGEEWAKALALVITGPLALVRSLRPALAETASLLFVTSSSVRQPIQGLDTSNALRPGVAALAKSLAQQLAPIRVNSIAPGRFDTDRVRGLDMLRAERRGVTPDEQRAETSRTIPLGRYGSPIEFGRVAAALLSPLCSYITGTSIQIDGGLVTAVP